MRDKMYSFLNKSIKEYNPTLLVACSIVFLSLVALISYKVSSSYALFTDTVNGTKTITLHYAEDKTTLYTDGTLIINERASDRAKNIQKHGAVTNEYAAMKTEGTDAEKYVFSASNQRPWNGQASSITSVEIGQVIQPTSTAQWFYGLINMKDGNFTNLDTSNVTSFYQMFQYAGQSATTWSIGDLSNWDTSKVTNMSYMFNFAGYSSSSWSIGDLSNWDTSKVIDMSYMFASAGRKATVWSIGDLSDWDTSRVTDMNNMFAYAGYSATTFNIGNLSNWDTSDVTSMGNMFQSAGQSATTWRIGDLSNWDTSKVTSMSQMFSSAGSNATTWTIGDLSNWDTSDVTSMDSMFQSAGQSASTWGIGDLSDWNTSSVTNMGNMFNSAGQSATTWNSIGTLKIYATKVYRMFYNCAKVKATLNIYSNPQSGTSGYDQVFSNAATASGVLITVNYSSATTNIDNIIATKSSNSHVVKGVQLD